MRLKCCKRLFIGSSGNLRATANSPLTAYLPLADVTQAADEHDDFAHQRIRRGVQDIAEVGVVAIYLAGSVGLGGAVALGALDHRSPGIVVGVGGDMLGVDGVIE